MKLKKLFGMAAMAALVLSGCSNDETVENFSPDNAIEFGTYVGRDAQSRGEIITTQELGEQGFGVFAYYTATSNFVGSETPNFMYNQKVEKATDATYENGKYSKWTYKPVKYWPNNVNDKVTFLAYAPYDVNKASNSITNGNIKFTVNSDIKKQIDLLWNSKEHVDETKQNVDGTIDFVFSHALSRLAFTVQAAVDEVEVANKVLDENTTITVHKVVLMGSETYNSESVAGAFYISGDLNLNNYSTDVLTEPVTASWSNYTKSQAFTLDKKHFVKGLDENNKEIEQDFVLNSNNSSQKNKLTADDSYLMIIPQDFSETETGSDKLYVYIEYTVFTDDPDREDNLNDSSIKNCIVTEAPINFESGKAYSINLCLGMTSVKLEATVATWHDESAEVDLPQNKPNQPAEND